MDDEPGRLLAGREADQGKWHGLGWKAAMRAVAVQVRRLASRWDGHECADAMRMLASVFDKQGEEAGRGQG